MEYDQLLFKRLLTFYRRITTRVDEAEQKRAVTLELIKPRLTLLARALTGRPNEVITSEREGGWSGLRLSLPVSVSFFEKEEDNLRFYLFRVLYLSVQQKLDLNWEDQQEHKVTESQARAKEFSEPVLQELFLEYPATHKMYEELRKGLEGYYQQKESAVDYSWLYGRWMRKNSHEFTTRTTTPNPSGKREEPQITTELEADPSDEVTTVALDKKQVEDHTLHNNFEKVETLSEFNGAFKEMDGDDTLSDDEDAMRELNLRYTVRADDVAHSLYRAEFVNSVSEIKVDGISEKGKYLFYDEWDYKKRRYKTQFCKVFPDFLTAHSRDYARQALLKNARTRKVLFELFAQVHNEFEKVSRVVSGEEIDLDMATDALVDIRAGRSPSDKVYTTKRKRKRDLSVLILMDCSLSADGYTDNEHVLDVEKTAVLLFGEVLSQYRISFQIDTFSSRTRNHCAYHHVKTFDETWHKTRNRVGAIEAKGYTRIGPALRHAGSLIAKQPIRNKWIILLSDGKPNDYDTYEGRYGIEDVKQALRELDKNHVRSFSLAIEARARYYLPQMFGHNNYHILPRPADLPLALSKFYKRILHD